MSLYQIPNHPKMSSRQARTSTLVHLSSFYVILLYREFTCIMSCADMTVRLLYHLAPHMPMLPRWQGDCCGIHEMIYLTLVVWALNTCDRDDMSEGQDRMCGICEDIIDEEQHCRSSCGHNFCRDCILDHINSTNGSNQGRSSTRSRDGNRHEGLSQQYGGMTQQYS